MPSVPRRGAPGGVRLPLIGALAMVLALAISIPVVANLGGSNFDAGDGNLILNDETKDWVNAPNLAVKIDKPTGQTDDSFGNGTKEDDPVPSIIDGSIPNNKSDLTRFYASTEKSNGDDFFYFAWERVQDPSGTTNMDIELNQSKDLSANGVTPVRTPGDVLFKYDLDNGGTQPTLGYHRWITSGNCEASGAKPPCWDRVHTLSGNFEASINNGGSVTDPVNPGAPRTLDIRTFGEAAINLTDSGITSGGCNGFASAYLKSRSSTSFTAAVKDFVEPANVNLNNCAPAVIKLKKKDTGGNPLSGAVMQLWKDNDNSNTINTGDTQVAPDGWSSGTKDCTTTGDGIGNCVFTLPASAASNGKYIGHEVTPPNGFTTSAPDVVQTVTIGASAQEFILEFTDSLAPGTVKLHKQDDRGIAMSGVTFTLYKDNGSGATAGPPDGNGPNQDQHGAEDSATLFTCTTNASGDCDITGVTPNQKYWVVEDPLTLPSGYDGAPDKYADVGAGATPGQGAVVDLTGSPFVNPRLHKIIVIVCHEGTNTLAGATVSLNGGGGKSTVTSDADAAKLCDDTTGAVFPDRKHTSATGTPPPDPDDLAVTIAGAANGTHP